MPVSLEASATVKAIAVKVGMTNSEVASAAYTIETPVSYAFSGAGTESNPFLITSADDWNTLSGLVNNGGADFCD